MSDDDKINLRPASPEEIEQTLSFAFRYDGRKRVRHADDAMARITAERLVLHLQKIGYVLMKKPAAAAPSSSHHQHPHPHADLCQTASHIELIFGLSSNRISYSMKTDMMASLGNALPLA